MLQRNVEGNRLSGVELHQAAVSDDEEPLVFFTSHNESPLRNSTIRARVPSPDEIRVQRLHLEYHHHIDGERNDFSQTLAQLEAAGFGYQVRADPHTWPTPRAFQDISIYAYR